MNDELRERITKDTVPSAPDLPSTRCFTCGRHEGHYESCTELIANRKDNQ